MVNGNVRHFYLPFTFTIPESNAERLGAVPAAAQTQMKIVRET